MMKKDWIFQEIFTATPIIIRGCCGTHKQKAPKAKTLWLLVIDTYTFLLQRQSEERRLDNT